MEISEQMGDAKVWFTSDTHFGLTRILDSNRHGPRVFSDIEHMDNVLINLWNQKIGENDTVLFLGDFCAYKDERLEKTFYSLNGNKHLIIGNHDQGKEPILSLPWSSKPEYQRLVCVENTEIYLSHYPMRCWPRFNWGAIHLYGHTHGGLPADNKSLDVGVDCWNYSPIDLNTILEKMKSVQPCEIGQIYAH